jgi:hypothetical protein
LDSVATCGGTESTDDSPFWEVFAKYLAVQTLSSLATPCARDPLNPEIKSRNGWHWLPCVRTPPIGPATHSESGGPLNQAVRARADNPLDSVSEATKRRHVAESNKIPSSKFPPLTSKIRPDNNFLLKSLKRFTQESENVRGDLAFVCARAFVCAGVSACEFLCLRSRIECLLLLLVHASLH